MRYSEAARQLRGFFTALALLLSLFVAGCGYHIAGKSGSMPGDVISVTIPVFTNATAKPDIEGIITSAFITELLTTIEVNKEASAVVRGIIKSYNLRGVSFTRTDVTKEYRLSVVISIVMTDKKDGKVLWEDKNISDYEDFTVDVTDVTRTEEVEIAVFKKLSKDLARKIKERMLEGF